MTVYICGTCGATVPEGTTDCPKCGGRVIRTAAEDALAKRQLASITKKLRPCPDCGREVSERAASCPHCGAPLIAGSAPPAVAQKKGGGWVIAAGIIVFLIVIGSMGDDNGPPLPSEDTYGISQPVPPPSPQLELLSYSWEKGYGYATLSGQVKNLTSTALDNVVAVASFYDSSGRFISSGDALIDYRPILPGQISPFSAMAPLNPEMAGASVEFKRLGGGTINTKYSER